MSKVTEDDLLKELIENYPEELNPKDVTIERFVANSKRGISWSAAWRYLEKGVKDGELVKVDCYDPVKRRVVNVYRRK